VNRKNDIIAAALIKTQIMIDSLDHTGLTTIDTTAKTIRFADTYVDDKREVRYSFFIGGVLPALNNKDPTLLIDTLYFPNKQFIEFHWKNDRQNGNPVSFSVSNSNAFFNTVDIDSYAIPELNRKKIDPKGWEKVNNFFIENGKRMKWIGVGTLIGGSTVLLLTK
jgi:hypothetical protein